MSTELKFIVVRIDPDDPDGTMVVSPKMSEEDAKRRLKAFNRLLDRGVASGFWKDYPFVYTVTEAK